MHKHSATNFFRIRRFNVYRINSNKLLTSIFQINFKCIFRVKKAIYLSPIKSDFINYTIIIICYIIPINLIGEISIVATRIV